jgi:hypothetical protein
MQFSGQATVATVAPEAELQKRLRNPNSSKRVQPAKGKSGGMATQGICLYYSYFVTLSAQDISGEAGNNPAADYYHVFCTSGQFIALFIRRITGQFTGKYSANFLRLI